MEQGLRAKGQAAISVMLAEPLMVVSPSLVSFVSFQAGGMTLPLLAVQEEHLILPRRNCFWKNLLALPIDTILAFVAQYYCICLQGKLPKNEWENRVVLHNPESLPETRLSPATKRLCHSWGRCLAHHEYFKHLLDGLFLSTSLGLPTWSLEAGKWSPPPRINGTINIYMTLSFLQEKWTLSPCLR